ncbi:polysaccharide pyruvyl transferase family protein [Chitinispirillales bacterium ANBcel5]|uniref:polysaccharide pyruvyl transferase family protein n=1 Tax=Cellulosispirillum alkaliphilum TaxID=3039283 RepID=UPI002A4E5DCC|nr:polysaccharide pyruvyl transferase family protein [Chitinispirillales bacterium ANBcel5]
MSRQSNLFQIGITGSYGGLNLGDEAILQCIISQIRSSIKAHITVFSKDPADTLKRHKVEKALAVRKLTREEASKEVERLDLLIFGGGGILYDADARTYLREPILAIEKKIPFMVYAISAGPLYDSSIQGTIKECLECADVITVRDHHSKRILQDIGIRKAIEVTADPALLLEKQSVNKETLKLDGIHPGKRLVGISVREPGVAAPDINETIYHDMLANTADYIIDRFNANVVFIPMERKVLDLQHSHAVISLMLRPQQATVLQKDYTAGQLLTIFSHFSFAVGMRLHFLIFAALNQIPLVGLPYSPKVNSFLEELHLEMPPIHLVNAGRLISHIDHAWDNKSSVAQRINRFLPALKKRAQYNNSIVVELLKSKSET